MKNLKFIALGIFLFLTGILEIKAQPVSGNAHSSVNSKIDQIMKKAVNDHSIPGVTIALSKNGRLVVNKAYGYANYEERKPMKTYHRTSIGSVSKIITALGIMKMAEQNSNFDIRKRMFGFAGVLTSTDYVDAYNRGVREQNVPHMAAWYRALKVNHFLSHSSGFGGYPDRDGIRAFFNVSQYSLKQQLQYSLIKDKLLFEPGTGKNYTNYGMGNIMRLLIKKVTGLEYGPYIDKKIFQPLDLHGDIVSAKHRPDKYDSNSHYRQNGKTITKELTGNGPELTTGASGGWASSARSLVRIMVATDQLPNYKDLLSRASLNEMETRPYPNASNHAIGWAWQKDGKRLTHNGAGGGGRAVIFKYKSGDRAKDGTDLSNINVAVCVNYENISMHDLNKLAGKLAVEVGKASISSGYDLFPSSDPAPPSGAHEKPGTVGKLNSKYKWSQGWSTARFFSMNGQTYLFMLKEKGYTSKGKNLHVNKVNSDGKIGQLVFSYKVSQGWTDAEFYSVGGKMYLMLSRENGYSSKGKNIHINRVNSNGTIGSLVHSYRISQGWSDIEIYKRGSSTFLMLLKEKGFTSKGKNVHINKLNSNGGIGSLVKSYKFSQGWSSARVYKKGSGTYLMLLKAKGFTSKGKNVHLNKINSNGTIGPKIADYRWGQGWTNVEFYKKGSKTFMLLLKEKGFSSKEKNVHINQVNNNGTIGAMQASYKWSEGWNQAKIFTRGNSTFLFLLKEKGYSASGKNVHLNKIR